MPELLDRLRRSGLVPADRLEGFLVGLNTSGRAPKRPAELLSLLIDARMISQFHADRLAVGKYKGFQLGSYLILDQLGTGGMGQVYLAEHSAMKRLVGLKVLPVWGGEDVVARERFFREARAAAALDHPNIVRVFDLCQEGRLFYLVMEYVDGISLQALVAKHGPLGVTEAACYARQVAYGLSHAHSLGFVHRDIKPANLLLERTGVVKILDLGLVRSEADAGSNLTKQLDNKSILGTADYVAPEQAVDSSTVDIRADIYSLGATLYFLLAGRPMFPEGRTAQKLVWQQIKDPTPIAQLRPDVPAELAGIVHTMIQKRPDDRFQSPEDVFDALAPWTQGDIAPPPESVMPAVGGRIAAAKTAVPGSGTTRVGGSTTQMVAAAMKSGPNSAVGLGKVDPFGPRSGGSSEAITPPPRPGLGSDTNAVAQDETKRTPSRPAAVPAPEPAAVKPRPAWQVVALAGAGATIAGLALFGLVKLFG
ncbi:MAG TPA: serine/threonine-protein kinase [Gemmataceae bacterium]|nr:serine/threonine-protein kinase [Gemmataceae bacterium]